jgi:hypothetical protein
MLLRRGPAATVSLTRVARHCVTTSSRLAYAGDFEPESFIPSSVGRGLLSNQCPPLGRRGDHQNRCRRNAQVGEQDADGGIHDIFVGHPGSQDHDDILAVRVAIPDRWR